LHDRAISPRAFSPISFTILAIVPASLRSRFTIYPMIFKLPARDARLRSSLIVRDVNLRAPLPENDIDCASDIFIAQ